MLRSLDASGRHASLTRETRKEHSKYQTDGSDACIQLKRNFSTILCYRFSDHIDTLHDL